MTFAGSASPPRPVVSRRPLTTALLAATMALLGLLSGLPFLVGAFVGVAGVLLSVFVRGRPGPKFHGAAPVPALGALVVLLFASAPVPSTELFGGLAALSLLLWLADDPREAPGGGRRATASLGFAALAFALAWGLSLAVAPTTENIGLAGILAALVLLAVALLLGRTAGAPDAETA